MTAALIAAIEPVAIRVSPTAVLMFVRVTDNAGRIGWGEATLRRQEAAVEAAVRAQGARLIGCPIQPLHAIDALGTDGRVDAGVAAACGIDMARWDLDGQIQGQPLVERLGLVVNDPVPLYANVNRRIADRSPRGFADSAWRAVAAGFTAIKVAPFDGFTSDLAGSAEGRRLRDAGLARIAAVRDAIGPKTTLLVDGHWRLDIATALSVLNELAGLGVALLESPLPDTAAYFDDIVRLRSAANDRGIQLAGGERQTGLHGFMPMLEAGLYDVIMPDVRYAGGLSALRAMAEQAFRRGTMISLHNPAGPIAHAVSLHVAASLPGVPFLEMKVEDSPIFFDLAEGLPRPKDGQSGLPIGAGIGVRLRPFSNEQRIFSDHRASEPVIGG